MGNRGLRRVTEARQDQQRFSFGDLSRPNVQIERRQLGKVDAGPRPRSRLEIAGSGLGEAPDRVIANCFG